MNAPATLDHAGIAARIPHGGAMCLLERLLSWDDEQIVCRAGDHTDPTHPLCLDGVLPAASALEFASQAMALHGALCSPAAAGPTPGFLASARGVRLRVRRLDDVPGPLRVRAQRLAGGDAQAVYAFELRDAHDRLLVDGRATVVFGAALTVPPECAS
ncbi:MAG TPA: hydroxymyristoyl-ACP dehydratase [Burkholderiaceae bacterium]|nr:hydroxymyristoyl-ACP dehydratase [Burkholderiaceae bacterium]